MSKVFGSTLRLVTFVLVAVVARFNSSFHGTNFSLLFSKLS